MVFSMYLSLVLVMIDLIVAGIVAFSELGRP